MAQSGRGPAAPGPVLVSRKPAAPVRGAPVSTSPWTTTIRPSSNPACCACETDPDGKLHRASKPSRPRWKSRRRPPPPFDWNKLFQAAGLDPAQFQTTEPTWTPLANWDTRAAWTGTDPATGAKLRIEAAAWRGRPVFFRIIGPWTVAGRMTPPGNNSGNSIPVLVIIYIALIAACVLGWHNVRSGRADLRGATRLSLIYFVCQASANLLEMHHTATHRRNRRLLDRHRRRHASMAASTGSSMWRWSRGCGASGRAP